MTGQSAAGGFSRFGSIHRACPSLFPAYSSASLENDALTMKAERRRGSVNASRQ